MGRQLSDRGRIDVIVRKRPLNAVEKSRGDSDIVSCTDTSAIISEPRLRIDGTSYTELHEFRVDRFYNETADNEVIYREYVKPLVEYAICQGRTCSCFTYGQTGSGKTFTMIGSHRSRLDSREYIPGIYEYAAEDIYQWLEQPEFAGKLRVYISFYEIYCGKLYDLLQGRKLVEALENGKREVVIKDLASLEITSKEELFEHMLNGLNLRRIGSNSQNDVSSRSHALLRIEFRDATANGGQGGKGNATGRNANGHGHGTRVRGRIVFIDLAGSERGADNINQPKQTQMDGAGINRSLLALKECIRAMDLEKTHIPFRDSELTKVLRDVFVGDSRNVMIANVCPSNVSCEQTLNTLRYASRVKGLRDGATRSSAGASSGLRVKGGALDGSNTFRVQDLPFTGTGVKSSTSKLQSAVALNTRALASSTSPKNGTTTLSLLGRSHAMATRSRGSRTTATATTKTTSTTPTKSSSSSFSALASARKVSKTRLTQGPGGRLHGRLDVKQPETVPREESQRLLDALVLEDHMTKLLEQLVSYLDKSNATRRDLTDALKLYMQVQNNGIEDVKDIVNQCKALIYLVQCASKDKTADAEGPLDVTPTNPEANGCDNVPVEQDLKVANEASAAETAPLE